MVESAWTNNPTKRCVVKFSNTLSEGIGVVYYPDFLLEDGVTIIEPKGYEKEVSVSKKTALAESLGYIVKVMRKDDLKYAFDYVEKTYGTKKFYNLLENKAKNLFLQVGDIATLNYK